MVPLLLIGLFSNEIQDKMVDGSDLGELPTAEVLAGDEGSTIQKEQDKS